MGNAKGSFPLDVRRLDNRRPASDVTLHEGGERLLTAARLVWDFQDNVEKPLAHILVVQSLVEGIGEFVEDRFRRRLGSKQGEPSQYLELRQPRFLRGRHPWEDRTAPLRLERIGFDRAALLVWHGGGSSSVAHVVDLTADESVHRRGAAIEGYHGWLHAEDRVEQQTAGES